TSPICASWSPTGASASTGARTRRGSTRCRSSAPASAASASTSFTCAARGRRRSPSSSPTAGPARSRSSSTSSGRSPTRRATAAGRRTHETADPLAIQQVLKEEAGYQRSQGTKPQTLAYALNGSPAGLAAWIVEKFRTWSDCDGEIERRFTKDQLLTNIMLYWVPETANSSCRLYYEAVHADQFPPSGLRVEVPTG